MGYDKHETVMAITREGSSFDRAARTLQKRVGATLRNKRRGPLHRHFIPLNGWVVWTLFPDGSKEGWLESAEGDRLRAEVVALFATVGGAEGFYACFAGDEVREAQRGHVRTRHYKWRSPKGA